MFATTMTAEEAIYKEECRQAEIDYLEQQTIDAHYEDEAMKEESVISQYYASLDYADEEIRLLMIASHDWGHLKGMI